jgi:hypothetical protein
MPCRDSQQSAGDPKMGSRKFRNSLSQQNFAHGCPSPKFRLLKYLLEIRDLWDFCASTAIALTGSLENLIWAREHGCPWNEATCSNAAASGNLEMLKYLHEQGCTWDEKTTGSAKNLKILQWAREHGCLWDETTCTSLAHAEEPKMLRWAREHGCPWDENTCIAAIQSNRIETSTGLS